jgi:hypothetical protein
MRCIAETDGQVEQLYDLACAAHEQRSLRSRFCVCAARSTDG